MKFSAAAPAAALVALSAEASASLLSPFSKFRPAEVKTGQPVFLLDDADLSTLADDPPSFVSSADSSYGFSADIVSLGSFTRMDYLTSQIETWASHRAVRHFWGFSELQDYDPECSAMSDEARTAIVDTCKASVVFKDPKIKSFFTEYYGLSEGHLERTNDAGWICAQRRSGRAFGWLHSQYAGGKTTIPEYLIIVDDDTYLDLVDVMTYLEKEEEKAAGRAFARAGCVFPQNEVIPFPLSYGGFGTILNKAAIQKLSEPIYCDEAASAHEAACALIEADTVGEAAVFEEGMTVFELFYKYAALKDFCMHSDWLLGYVLEYYLNHSVSNPEHEDTAHSLVGMMDYPSCGNVTVATGTVRRCTLYSDTCHNQGPKDMEALAISSYALSPDSYKAIPKMEMTDIHVAMDMVKSKEHVSSESARLPNLFLLGDNEAFSSSVAEFLLSNGVCGPDALDGHPDKSAHYFDREDLFNRGVGAYAKRFEHCSDRQLVMDDSHEVVKHAELIYDMYHQVHPDSLSNIKMIAILLESHPGEYGSFLGTWAGLFDREQLLVLSASELHEYPKRSQWRIEQFLGQTFGGSLNSVDYAHSIPFNPIRTSIEMYDGFNHFMEESQGPWMEQRPFPRAIAPKTFAYASVLGWNPDSSQNTLYLHATRILIRTLKDSAADFVVLMMYEDEEAEEAIRAEGATVKHVSPIEHSMEVTHFEPWFVDTALAKLRAFELTQYERVQVLDVDSMVLDASRMDKLFTSFRNVKLVAEGLGSDSPLRAGWLLIRPSVQDFNAMQELLGRGVFTKQHGWDNLDLPVQYPGWMSKNPLINWEFYGSQLEQGLLFHQFYALPKSLDPSADDSELLTLLTDETLISLGFVHFYGDQKPWANNIASSLPTPVELARKRWLEDFQDLSSDPAPRHVSPLTPIGVKQYRRALALYSPTTSPTAAPVTPMPVSTPTRKPTPVTPAPTSNPTASPVLPETIIIVSSTLQWNSSCAGLNDTERLQQAQIIEKALYTQMKSNLTNQGSSLLSVLVRELCNATVMEHPPYPPLIARFLQASQSGILVDLTVSQTCSNCSESIFNSTDTVLTTIVDNGSLNQQILTLSNGTIDGQINAVTNSTFEVVTSSPTASPSASPTSRPTNFPTSLSPTTASPTSASPTSASPTSASPTTASPTSASPTSARPTTASPTSASPTSASPTSASPTSASPTSASPTSASPTSARPTSASPTSASPTSASPTSASPTSASPTTASPTSASPTTALPTTSTPTRKPTNRPTPQPQKSGKQSKTSPSTSRPTNRPVTPPPSTSQPTNRPVTPRPTSSTSSKTSKNRIVL